MTCILLLYHIYPRADSWQRFALNQPHAEPATWRISRLRCATCLSELSYAQREGRSPSQATVTVTVTNLRLAVSVDIKETVVRNIPGRSEQKQLDGDLSAATP